MEVREQERQDELTLRLTLGQKIGLRINQNPAGGTWDVEITEDFKRWRSCESFSTLWEAYRARDHLAEIILEEGHWSWITK